MTSPKISALSSDEQMALPCEEDIATYENDGCWVTGKIFSDAEINALKDGADAVHAGYRDVDLWRGRTRTYLDWRPGDPPELRLNDYVALQNKPFFKVLEKSVLMATAARLARSPVLRLFNSSLVYKGAHSERRVGWHTDKAYWKTCSSENMLTAWIPLQDCGPENGSLEVLVGSHRGRNALGQLTTEKNFMHEDPERLDEVVQATTKERWPRRILDVPKGHVSFHHCLVLHGSGPNMSEAPRMALVLHLQDESNRYRAAKDKEGNPIDYSLDPLVKTVDGRPDYTDRSIFPVVWCERLAT